MGVGARAGCAGWWRLLLYQWQAQDALRSGVYGCSVQLGLWWSEARARFLLR